MSANTSIEWTDRTWNPVRGCGVVSPGCHNCYAMTMAHRFSGMRRVGDSDIGRQLVRGAYHGLTKQTKAGPQWTGVIRTVEDALLEPLSWKKPARVFVNSMSDLFHEDVPDEFIDKVFAVMAMASQHTFQVLTKRQRRMLKWLLTNSTGGRIFHVAQQIDPRRYGASSGAWPLPNVWLGVSVENQCYADERIPLLLQTPAAVRFISAEPLLGPVNLEPYIRNSQTIHLSVDVQGALANRSFDGFTENGRALSRREAEDRLKLLGFQGVKLISAANGECAGFSDQTGCPGHPHQRIDWAIVGGESGPGARPCEIPWVRSLVRQCVSARTPVFVKQLGSNPWCGSATNRDDAFIRLADSKGGDPSEWPEDLRVREFPAVHA